VASPNTGGKSGAGEGSTAGNILAELLGGCARYRIRALTPLTPNTVELIHTLGALSPRGGPVQDPVLTPGPFKPATRNFKFATQNQNMDHGHHSQGYREHFAPELDPCFMILYWKVVMLPRIFGPDVPRSLLSGTELISQNVFVKSFCKSQFPHEFVILSSLLLT